MVNKKYVQAGISSITVLFKRKRNRNCFLL